MRFNKIEWNEEKIKDAKQTYCNKIDRESNE